MLKDTKNNSKGFTLVEILISVAILTIMMGAIALFVKNIFNFNKSSVGSLTASTESRNILNPVTSELRSASTSSLGAYPIDTATDSVFTFYTDVDADGPKEKVRYFYSNNKLNRGVIKPVGNPVNYNGTETITTIVSNVRNTAATPIFSYYDTNYTGSGSALVQPVAIAAIRLVKITLIIDADTTKPPAAITATTQASLRNLKDNL